MVLDRVTQLFLQFDKKSLNKMSWGVAIAMSAGWIYESERSSPKFFQEAPTLIGTPQARVLTEQDFEKWNSAMVPKEDQVSWKPEPGQAAKRQ
mmetsp:Transcript_41237/g.118165  ORF Transcript_41237/g.118165 Transcript_41237/m.118165 type:complete len:93 (+) Transcript_41237:111-389(+)